MYKEDKIIREGNVDVKSDYILRDYWKDRKHFADLFNGLIFDGEDVIDYNQLHSEDSAYEELMSCRDTIICGKEGPGETGRIPHRGWQLERQHHQKN